MLSMLQTQVDAFQCSHTLHYELKPVMQCFDNPHIKLKITVLAAESMGGGARNPSVMAAASMEKPTGGRVFIEGDQELLVSVFIGSCCLPFMSILQQPIILF